MFTKGMTKLAAILLTAILAGLVLPANPGAASAKKIKIDITVNLEGATRAGQSAMSTALNDRNLIKSTDPYGFGETYNGVADAVDWVEIELRDPATLAVVSEGAAILRSDGSVVTGDGDPFRLTADPNGTYHMVVRHRNHIPEQSPPVNVHANKFTFNFTTNQIPPYNGVYFWHVDLNGDGLFGAVPANGDQSTTYDLRVINSFDRAVWAADNGLFDQYLVSDYNLDGDVNGADKIVWSQTHNLAVFVPAP